MSYYYRPIVRFYSGKISAARGVSLIRNTRSTDVRGGGMNIIQYGLKGRNHGRTLSNYRRASRYSCRDTIENNHTLSAFSGRTCVYKIILYPSVLLLPRSEIGFSPPRSDTSFRGTRRPRRRAVIIQCMFNEINQKKSNRCIFIYFFFFKTTTTTTTPPRVCVYYSGIMRSSRGFRAEGKTL